MAKIVVGLDGSELSTAALQWAVQEAQVHGADVEAVMAWGPVDQHHPDRSDRLDDEYDEADAGAPLSRDDASSRIICPRSAESS